MTEKKYWYGDPDYTPTELKAKVADELLEALERFVEGGYGGSNGNICMWCGSETRDLHNRVCRLGNAEAVIRKAKGGQQ